MNLHKVRCVNVVNCPNVLINKKNINIKTTIKRSLERH